MGMLTLFFVVYECLYLKLLWRLRLRLGSETGISQSNALNFPKVKLLPSSSAYFHVL